MKKPVKVALVVGAITVVGGAVVLAIKNQLDKELYGLQEDEFEDDDEFYDEEIEHVFDDEDDYEESDYEDDYEDDTQVEVPANVDDVVAYFEGLSNEQLATIGITDRSAVDFKAVPITVLTLWYNSLALEA